MEFRESRPIYLQIADHICEKILMYEWKQDERVPSVRELAVSLQVNPNTVMRTYEFLQQQDIIYNQRGIGYFVSAKAYKNSVMVRKDDFLTRDLPHFFRTLILLDMSLTDLKSDFEKYKKKHFRIAS
jgi:DNA-binding transcriptional regulator YhcF (GntR family)